MALYKKLNYATGTLASGIADDAVEVVLNAGHSITTNTGIDNNFIGVFFSGSETSPYQDANREIVDTYRTDTNTFTITRAQEGTSAKAWSENDNFMLIASAGVFDEYETSLDGKAPLTAPTFATSITGSYLTASEILITDANKNIVSAPVATYPSLTELSYVKGLSSSIQSQLNAKGVGDMLLSGVQSVTGLKTFNKDKVAMKGTSTGVNTISVANTSATSYTNTLPAKNGTFAMTDDIVSQVEDNITDGHTTVAPSGNAVFDALALKANLDSPTFTGTVTLPKTTKIQDTSADHTYNLAVSELTADRIVTLPLLTGNDEFVFKDHTQTLTKKRINPRLVTATSYTTDTGTSLDVSTCDQFEITAQAGDLKFNNPSGTPLGGQKLVIRIKDNGNARALTYDTQFRAVGVELPATTVISKTLYMGFIFNATDTKWDLLAVANEA